MNTSAQLGLLVLCVLLTVAASDDDKAEEKRSFFRYGRTVDRPRRGMFRYGKRGDEMMESDEGMSTEELASDGKGVNNSHLDGVQSQRVGAVDDEDNFSRQGRGFMRYGRGFMRYGRGFMRYGRGFLRYGKRAGNEDDSSELDQALENEVEKRKFRYGRSVAARLNVEHH